MKLLKNPFFAFLFSMAVSLSACHSKSANETTKPNVDTTTTTTTPVQIESDEVLKNGVKDATKDFPGVSASVNNGEITLTGEITRNSLPKLMQSLNALHPKKINNTLTIK